MATASDDSEIPVSLVYRRELTMDGTPSCAKTRPF